MNIDTRINNDFFDHPKTFQLQTQLGEVAVLYVIKLWLYVSKFFPDGIIRGMDANMLENKLGWSQNHKGKLIEALENIGFLDKEGSNFVVHDWIEHNCYASDEGRRKKANRFNSLKRYMPDVANLLEKNKIKAISSEQYKALKSAKNALNEAKILFNLQTQKNDNLHMQSHMQSHMQNGDAKNENRSCDRIAQIPSTNSQLPNKKINNLSHTKNSDTTMSDNLPQSDAGYEREKTKGNFPDTEEDIPSMEFQELREYYDNNARPEGPRAGWIEFKRLKKATGLAGRDGYYPGVHALMDDIDKRIAGGFWDKGYEPSLAKYLNDRTWEQEVTSRTRGQPKTFDELAADRERQKKENTLKRLKAMQEGNINEL